MSRMSGRIIRTAIGVFAALYAGAVLAAPPTRFLPAPKGRGFLQVFGSAFPVAAFEVDETSIEVPSAGGGHDLAIKWNAERYEFGATGGLGLGPWWFVRAMDLSVSVPFTFYSYTLDEYVMDETAGMPYDSQHASMKGKVSGIAISDMQMSLLTLLYADSAAGTWIGGAIKVNMPTGNSGPEQFVRRLRGNEKVGPADGSGVLKLVPAVSGVKMISGQRFYVNLEYALPLGKQSFDLEQGELKDTSDRVYDDSTTTFREEFAPGGVIAGTLGVETSMNFWGMMPGIEVTFRQFMPTEWKENGRDGAETAGSVRPLLTSGYVKTAAWASGNVALESVTELEIALTASMRVTTGDKGNDMIKMGLVYVTNNYGNMIGAKATFTNLFEGRSDEEMARMRGGGANAMEVQVSPVIDAPPAPTGRIETAVMLPSFGEGVTQEQAEWLANQVRDQLKRTGGYAVMPEKEMAQIAQEPCGGAECGVRFGRALKQQAMVVGNVGRTEAGVTLTLRMVSVGDGTVSSSASASASDVGALKSQLPQLLKKLTRPGN